MPQHTQLENAYNMLNALKEGNQRFVNNVRSIESMLSLARRDDFLAGQAPKAVVLSCSDARVPSEMVFDCGLGELFVVRVAGNVVAPSIVGSIEFAIQTYHTPLVIVMGHSRCGAVAATIDVIQAQQQQHSDNIHDIVARIAPCITELLPAYNNRTELLKHAIRANIRASTSHLRHASQVLESAVDMKKLLIVGAEYALETGEVDFFDFGLPPPVAT